jgi:hypothetical protein
MVCTLLLLNCSQPAATATAATAAAAAVCVFVVTEVGLSGPAALAGRPHHTGAAGATSIAAAAGAAKSSLELTEQR